MFRESCSQCSTLVPPDAMTVCEKCGDAICPKCNRGSVKHPICSSCKGRVKGTRRNRLQSSLRLRAPISQCEESDLSNLSNAG